MADNERHQYDSAPGETFDITPESIEAFRHSDPDLNELFERIKHDSKLALAFYALAEDYRRHGHTTEDKTAFIKGVLTSMKIHEMQKDSEPLAEIFELPSYVDDNHTPTDPLSA